MEIYNELGAGSYGSVFQCKYNGKFYAAKFIVLDISILDVLTRELVLLSKLQRVSDHVANVYYAGIVSQKYFVLLLEQCYKIHKKNEKSASMILSTLGHALLTIHDHDILHRDIAPNNIMLRPNGKVAFIDFGLACLGPSKNCRSAFSSHVTTISTRAPELIKANKFLSYGKEIDVYSIAAVSLYYSGLPLYYGDPKTDNYETNVWPFLYSSISKIPDERYRFSKLLSKHDRPSLRSAIQDLPRCSFEAKPLPEPKEILKTYEFDFVVNIFESTVSNSICDSHLDFSESLRATFEECIHGHSMCITKRTKTLAALLCNGDCLVTACVCFSICWSFHEHIKSDHVKNLVKYCKLSQQKFLVRFSECLCQTSLLKDFFSQCETKSKDCSNVQNE